MNCHVPGVIELRKLSPKYTPGTSGDQKCSKAKSSRVRGDVMAWGGGIPDKIRGSMTWRGEPCGPQGQSVPAKALKGAA